MRDPLRSVPVRAAWQGLGPGANARFTSRSGHESAAPPMRRRRPGACGPHAGLFGLGAASAGHPIMRAQHTGIARAEDRKCSFSPPPAGPMTRGHFPHIPGTSGSAAAAPPGFPPRDRSLPTIPPLVAAALLCLAAAMLGAVGMRWQRPRSADAARQRAWTLAWVLGDALMAAAAVTLVRVALGAVAGDGPLAPPLGWLVRGEVVALVGFGLLIGFVDSHTHPGLRFGAAASAGAASLAASACVEALGLHLEPGPLVGVAGAALLAPLLLSAGSRALLITRIRKEAIAAAGDHILIVGPAGRLLHVPERTRRILKIDAATVDGSGLPSALEPLIRDDHPRRARLRTRSGHVLDAWATRPSARGRASKARGILLRNATKRYQDENRLVRLAHYDSLTGLANRRLFLENLTKLLGQREADATRFALFYLDLDEFKSINDSLGHGVGDALLEGLAKRLGSALQAAEAVRLGMPGASFSIARLSGDEFAIIASPIPDGQSAQDLAAWILDLIAKPIQLGNHELNVSASVGIALSPDDGSDLDTLIRHADTALYAAKERGRRRYARYEASFDEKSERARKLEEGLRHAIERDELQLFYQPKVDARTGVVTGFEALMRWNSAELGSVGPAEFIPIAEERGLVSDLGTWALQRACRQLREWRDSGFTIVPVAVNVSSRQFKEVDLQSAVSDALTTFEIDPHYLELELTESLLLEEGDRVEVVLRDLRSIGVRIALDDFGTGYSALTYLNRFTLDVLKMDRALLRDIESNPAARGIVSAVVSMSHSLGLTVVAEGIDCAEQVPILQNMRCDHIQGFLYSPAVPPAEAVQFLAQAGKPAPVCKQKISEAPPARTDVAHDEALEVVEFDDSPVLRDDAGPAASLDEIDRSAGRAASLGNARGRVLFVDDGTESLGLVALRLSRLGIDSHYASEIDEGHMLIAQEFEGIRLMVAPPSIDLERLGVLRHQLAQLSGDAPRVIVVGERPDDVARTAIREAGVDWVMWAPFNDAELRALMKSALATPTEMSDRREPRVPVDLLASISCGKRREVVVVSSLSARGAYLETNDPLPVGSSLRIEMDTALDRFRGFARVVHVQKEDPRRPQEPSGMGVAFFGSDRDTERILRKAVKELEARHLP